MTPLYENRKADIYCRDSRRTGKSIRYSTPHIHRHVEIAVILSGRVNVQIDNEPYDVGVGDIIVIFPNQAHSYEPIEPEQHLMAIVNPDLFPEFGQQFKNLMPVSNLVKSSAENDALIAMIKKLDEEYMSDTPYRETVMRGYLLVFFGELFRKMQWMDERSEDYGVLEAIMNFCIKNFDKDLSLSVLEKELYISKSYISRIINTKLGMGFNDYINSIRISNACKLLSSTSKTITEISTLVGFNTSRTFNRAFIKQMEMTPREYQMKIRTEIGIASFSAQTSGDDDGVL